jgi:uncharacterized protein (TIGR00645 family)
MQLRGWLRAAEHFWENYIIFGARWVLAPAYLILVFALLVLAFKTVEEFFNLIIQVRQSDEARSTAQVLVIIDLILVMNLVLMVLFVGYVNFVSIIDPEREEDWPKWMGYLDYSGLKIQVIGSIIAISAIKLLRVFVDMTESDHVDIPRVVIMISLHITFVVSALILAIVNKLSVKRSASHESVETKKEHENALT